MKFLRFLVGWWGAGARPIPATPADRIFSVEADTRLFAVAAESRRFTV